MPDLLERDFARTLRARTHRALEPRDAARSRRSRNSASPRSCSSGAACRRDAERRAAGVARRPCASSASTRCRGAITRATLRARVALLREACPELGLPDLVRCRVAGDARRLAGAASGRQDAARCADARSSSAKRWQRNSTTRSAARVDELAPETLARAERQLERRLHYEPGKPPVLAVKLQELFGLADTPRIAKGRVPVDAASAVAGAAADPGHAGFARLLGAHVSGSEKGTEGPLSATSVARRSVVGDADGAGQAARDVSAEGRARDRVARPLRRSIGFLSPLPCGRGRRAKRGGRG